MSTPFHIYTILTHDVDRRSLGLRLPDGTNHHYLIGGNIGHIMDQDINKRVFAIRNDADDAWIIQVESNRQLHNRLHN